MAEENKYNLKALQLKIAEMKESNQYSNNDILKVKTELTKYLESIDESNIENNISESIETIVKIIQDECKDQELMTLSNKVGNNKNEYRENFAKKFIQLCKKISEINDPNIDNVCGVLQGLNEVKDNVGIRAYQISLILHCILPSYIPIFRLDKPDIFKIYKNANNERIDEGNICNFSSNVASIHKFCKDVKEFPRGENNNGYDFALIDDALLALDDSSDGVAENELETDNVGGNEMSENNNKEFDKNMILFGPPGTGKTYNTVIYAVAICNGFSYDNVVAQSSYEETLINYKKLKEQGRIAFTTFHQSYGYEEFIEGIKPVIENGQNSADSNANEDAKETNNEADNKSKDVKYEIKSGVFKSFCDVAKKDPDNSYVFIIDEINRGNISKIFGELITLIEPTKRTGEAEAMEAILPYSNESFGVPKNVYIIGTMNTADRSIALMDTALRRRFQFVEMLPDPEVLKVDKDNDIIVSENKNGNLIEVNVKTLLTKINKRIEYLYDREHTIGHAFFTKLRDNSTIDELGKIFEKSVIPLLQEYFYDDYKKIMLVLGYDPKPNDNNKTNQSPNDQLIIATKLEKSSIFKGDTSDIDIPEYSYEIDKKAFINIESYTKICNENKK